MECSTRLNNGSCRLPRLLCNYASISFFGPCVSESWISLATHGEKKNVCILSGHHPSKIVKLFEGGFQIQGFCTLHSPKSGGYALEWRGVVLNHCNMSPKLPKVPLPRCGIRLHAWRLSEHWLSCCAILLHFQLAFLSFPWNSTHISQIKSRNVFFLSSS